MKNNKYKKIKELSLEDQADIYQFAIKRSNEIIFGVEKQKDKTQKRKRT